MDIDKLYEKMWEIDDKVYAIQLEIDYFSLGKEVDIGKLRVERLKIYQQIIKARLDDIHGVK